MEYISKVKIRPYRSIDYAHLRRILEEADLFDKIWDSKANLKKKIRTRPKSIIVAVEDGKIIGCIYAQTDGWGGFLWRLAVSSQYRRQGVGTKLLNSAELFLKKKGVKEMALWVNSKNTGLHKYYKKRGYIASKNTFKFFYKRLRKLN